MKKKIIGIILCGVLAVSVLSACGTDDTTKNTPSTAAPKASDSKDNNDSDKKDASAKDGSETAKPGKVNAKGDDKDSTNTEKPVLQTAEEAQNDNEVIEKEIKDIDELIEIGAYDDALMQMNSLATKNLTDEQKEKVLQIIELLEENDSELRDAHIEKIEQIKGLLQEKAPDALVD